MSKVFAIKAELRKELGKSAARRLKEAGKIPAVVYGPGKEPKAIAVDTALISKRHKQGRFYTQVCEIELDGKKISVIPKDLYRHPVTDNLEHVDFYELDDKIKVRIKAQIVTRNDDKCVGIKQGGIVSQSVRKIDLLCFPKDIISEIEVDISALELGASIHLSELTIPGGVEVISKSDQPIVAVVGKMAEISSDDEESDGDDEGEEGSEEGDAEAPAEEAKKDE